MSTGAKPTIVIVGGAFHTPESYGKLKAVLEGAGYEVHVPRLPSCNEARPPNAELTNDTEHIRTYVEHLANEGHRVVVIGHSYGGQVCSNALTGLGLEARSSQGLKGGVASLIYLAGYALIEGRSTLDKFQEFGKIENMPLVFDMAEDHTIVPRNPRLLFGLTGPGVDEAEIETYIETLCRWHGKGMFQPLERASWRELPVAYIHTTLDTSIPLAEQESMVKTLETTGRKVPTFSVEAGHCPNFTAPQGILGAVNAVVLTL